MIDEGRDIRSVMNVAEDAAIVIAYELVVEMRCGGDSQKRERKNGAALQEYRPR